MSQGKTDEEIQQVCRNVCDQRGINYDEALQRFRSMSTQFGINL